MTLELNNSNYESILRAFIYSISSVISNPDCDLDKPLKDSEWSLRQHIYHLLDTPKDGLYTVINQAIENSSTTLSIVPDLDNLNVDRNNFTVSAILDDLNKFQAGFLKVLKKLNDVQLDTLIIETSFPLRGIKENRSVRLLLDRLFVRHWSEHIYDMTK
tara:strand:+ start:15165 stop:15641 length:477 start_codon:yes stop_codon:yes gene_type:complete